MRARSTKCVSRQTTRIVPAFAIPNRAAIEAEIERLIALLDACDGDCDLEDDDPAGEALDRGERGGDVGDADDLGEFAAVLPVYGIDQSAGPINEREAIRAYRLRQAAAA